MFNGTIDQSRCYATPETLRDPNQLNKYSRKLKQPGSRRQSTGQDVNSPGSQLSQQARSPQQPLRPTLTLTQIGAAQDTFQSLPSDICKFIFLFFWYVDTKKTYVYFRVFSLKI